MTNISVHVRRVTLATLIFVALAAIAVGLFKRHWDAVHLHQSLRVNTLAVLPRTTAVTCDQIRQKDGDYARVHLVVDGMDTGMKGVGCTDSPPTASFEFRHVQPNGLSREADEAVWGGILGHPLRTLHGPRELAYDVQWLAEGQPVAHLAEPRPVLRLRIFDWWAPAVLMLVLYVWFMLGYLGRTTALLRDPAPAGTPLAQRTYSLARTQMAWWFAVIFASLVFLWLVTGESPSLSAQALALLGISGATTMASTGLSANRPHADGVAGAFFVDLLSDDNGVAIHRFQMLVITITLGLMFLFSVATTLTMPEFDGSLLTLMGLSAGTYVALKIPEERVAAPATPSVATDPKSAYSPTP